MRIIVYTIVRIFDQMQHKGEIIEKAVRESGYSITRLAQQMGKSRKWLYNLFKNPNVGVDYVIQIGRHLKHDFSREIKDLREYKHSSLSLAILEEDREEIRSSQDEIEFWKNKYLEVLEKYADLLSQVKS